MKVVPALVKTLEAAAATGKLLDLSSVDPAEASRMDAALTEPLNELTKLRNRLCRQARTT